MTLEFAKKYTQQHSENYFNKHEHGFMRKLSNWRELKIAKKALKKAENPSSVLDLPCGTGRFWSLLAEKPQREIYACDLNQSMIDTALKNRPKNITERIRLFQGSAFEIPLADNTVETVFSMRLLHHIGESEDRKKILKEFYRVATKSACISLWVDGNFKSYRRKVRERRKHNKKEPFQNRFMLSQQQVEKEFSEVGFKVIDCVYFLRYYSMLCVYVLQK